MARDKTNMDARYVPNGTTGGDKLGDGGLTGGTESFAKQYGASPAVLEKGYTDGGKFKAKSDPKKEA